MAHIPRIAGDWCHSQAGNRFAEGVWRIRAGRRSAFATPRRPRLERPRPCDSRILIDAVAGAVLATAATAQGAPTTLAVEPGPTRVAAWDGVAMWSRLDAATNTYSLVKSVDGGAPTNVAVAPRAGDPFDIDLGTNRSGATYAVYTRDDGDIYRLDVATGSETKVAKLSSPSLVERDPTIMRGEIAFIRRDGGYDQLRIGNTTSGSKGSRLIVRRRSILSAELGFSHVAYVESVPSEFREARVHNRNIRTGADRMIYRAKSGGANSADVTRPSFFPSPQAFVWARTNVGSGTGNRIVRYTLSGSRMSYAQGSPFYNSTAWLGGDLGAVTASSLDNGESPGACADGPTNHCQVQLTGPLQFGLRP